MKLQLKFDRSQFFPFDNPLISPKTTMTTPDSSLWNFQVSSLATMGNVSTLSRGEVSNGNKHKTQTQNPNTKHKYKTQTQNTKHKTQTQNTKHKYKTQTQTQNPKYRIVETTFNLFDRLFHNSSDVTKPQTVLTRVMKITAS